MQRHIVITGGAGFIGSHVVDRLAGERLADGSPAWRITVVDDFDPFYPRLVKEENLAAALAHDHVRLVERSILADDLEDLVGDAPVDVLLHLAAKAGVRPSIADPITYHRVNVTGTLRLLEWARRRAVPHVVLASSSSVYGEHPDVPWKETSAPLRPISPYAATKIAAEQFAQVYSRLHGMRVTILRFFTVFGPRQRPDLAIHQFFAKIRAGTSIKRFGDGSTQRDYTYVGDIVQGVRAAIDRERGDRCETYNLGNSRTVMLRELIAAIEEVAGTRALIEHLPEQPGDVPRTFADISKAGDHLGYHPATTLHEGLRAFKAWMDR